MTSFTACIPSIGRVSLLRTIGSIQGAALPEGASIDLVVGDDSLDGAATRLVEGAAADGGLRKDLAIPKCVTVASRNISTARNICIANAKSEYLLFVDDDEWVAPDLLLNLQRTMIRYEADAVFGAVKGVYPESAPKWSRDIAPYDREVPPTGSVVKTGATSIVLIRRDIIDRLNLTFDPELGRSGGEDTDFFDRMSRGGGKLVTCQEAVVFEDVPLERLKIGYILRRYMRGGQSFARTKTANAAFLQRMTFAMEAAVKVLFCSILSLSLLPIDRGRSIAWQIQFAGNVGKLRQVLGLPLSKIY